MTTDYKHEYWVWAAMLDRCRNPNSRQYRDYGGRGINVCERWQRFENFLADMGRRPDGPPRYTLDRIENDGDYAPGNCRWVTHGEQAKNKRQYRKNGCGINGVHQVRGRWRARIRVSGQLIHLGYFGSLEAAAAAVKTAARANGFSPTHGERHANH